MGQRRAIQLEQGFHEVEQGMSSTPCRRADTTVASRAFPDACK